MVMAFMGRGGLPDVPDPTKIVKSGADAAKAIVQGGVGAGMDIADGTKQILFQTVEGGAKVMYDGIGGLVNVIKRDVETGKTTIERVRGDIDSACNSVLSQVDQAVGGEIVIKFKREIERQLR